MHSENEKQVHSNLFPISSIAKRNTVGTKTNVLYECECHTDHTEDAINSWVGLQFLSLQWKNQEKGTI